MSCICGRLDPGYQLRQIRDRWQRAIPEALPRVRLGATGCPGRTVPMEKLDNLVAEYIEQRLLQPKRLEQLLSHVLDRRTERAERRKSHIADLRKRAAEADAKLKRLYDAIENGVADLSDPMLKDRIAELKATRDQARLDAERAEEAIDRGGPTRPLPGQPASECGLTAAATAATISAHSPNASKSIRKNCASWDRKARSCARSSPLQAQKRQVLACPVLYRSGAPEEIRTPDPQIRSLGETIEIVEVRYRNNAAGH